MKTDRIDLHCHSTASDGTLSPTEVVELAAKRGLSALSLTDHDTIAGVAEAAAAARIAGIDFLSGIEISAEFPLPGILHLLGYGIDIKSLTLQNMTNTLLAGRDTRNPKIIARLQQLGVSITMDEVNQEAGGKVVGRPHIAAILVRKGYVSSSKQAFDKYLAPGGLAYFEKERLTPANAISMIRQSGGIAVLAHPVELATENDAQLETILKNLIDLGLQGIEVLHSDHNQAWVDKCTALAGKYKLLQTGGSDFHGKNKKDADLGQVKGGSIPRRFYLELVQRLK